MEHSDTSYSEQLINISYFYDLVESTENCRRLTTCPKPRAPLYFPMLILACLTGVSGLVVYLCQWMWTTSQIQQLISIRTDGK